MVTTTDWVDACIYIMDVANSIGSYMYPFILGANLIRIVAEII